MQKDRKPYGFDSVDLEFYRSGEEDGKYAFQTMTESKGKPVLFTSNHNDIGNFEDAIILCIKNESDRFHYQILDK